MFKKNKYLIVIIVIVNILAIAGCQDDATKPKDDNLIQIDTIEYVKIGTQIWMTKNLDVSHYRNGDSIIQVTDTNELTNIQTGAWCYYNNDSVLGKKYGKLYNWYAVNDSRGLAPEGWHIPRDEEWSLLINHLGGQQVAGGKLKELGTENWDSPNNGATNESSFYALPGGYCSFENNRLKFSSLKEMACWWSSSWTSQILARIMYLSYSDSDIKEYLKNKNTLISVRCVKGDKIPEEPVITELNPSQFAFEDIIVIKGKNFTNSKQNNYVTFGSKKAELYVNWSDSSISVIVPADCEINSNVSVNVDLMQSNFIPYNIALIYGQISDTDGNFYKTVKIGSQWWMTENLQVSHYSNGDTIKFCANSQEWYDAMNNGVGAWCYYNNDSSLGKIYGKLYNMHVVVDSRGLALNGWRIPSANEFLDLENYFGGHLVAGGKLKGIGTIENKTGLWLSPNLGATNASGFNGIPAGQIDAGKMSNLGEIGVWWTSTHAGVGSKVFGLSYLHPYTTWGFGTWGNGLSIRLTR